jgi:predicted metal-binding membrane protein
MNAEPSVVRSSFARTLQQIPRLYPEWWTLLLAGCAWVALLRHGWQHAGHAFAPRMTFVEETSAWLVMVAAMMLPLVGDAIRQTALGSLWSRRNWAIAEFVAGYFGPWLLMGVAFAGIRQSSWSHVDWTPALAFASTVLWLPTTLRRRALAACHRRVPLAPWTWRADRDCVRFGWLIGSACVGRCWPLMLACAFAGHGLVATAGGMAVIIVERSSFRPRTRTAAAGAALLAVYFGALAVGSQLE